MTKMIRKIMIIVIMIIGMTAVPACAATKGTEENPLMTLEEIEDYLINKIKQGGVNDDGIMHVDCYIYDSPSDIGSGAMSRFALALQKINDDYIRSSFSKHYNVYSRYYKKRIIHYKATIQFHASSKQMNDVYKNVSKIVSQLHLKRDTDYVKVRKIYDWIIKNVKYDDEYTDNVKTGSSFNAYSAIRYKKTVCQGYAELFYLMCKQAGIQSRVIFGTCIDGYKKDTHEWNVVKVNGRWYYCDPTWDAIYYEAGRLSRFFLKGNLKNHTRIDKRMNSEFVRNIYPTSDYGMYQLLVEGGTGTGYYKTGQTAKVKAKVPKGASFKSWTMRYPNGYRPDIGSLGKKSTKLKIYSEVSLKAEWTYKSTKLKKKTYKIKGKGGYIQIPKNSKKVNTDAVIKKKPIKSSKWKFIKKGKKYYIQNRKTKLYLTRSGNRIIQDRKKKATKWTIVKSSKNMYRFINGKSAITVLGKKLIMKTDTNAKSQRFQLK